MNNKLKVAWYNGMHMDKIHFEQQERYLEHLIQSKTARCFCNLYGIFEVEFSHEAKIGKISDQSIFYLMSRGLSEEDAKAMIVRGFADPISKALPMEYAVEMNNLINLELEGAIG